MKTSLIAVLLGILIHTHAWTDYFYVRPDSGRYGNGKGTDWNNAFSGLPADSKRGSAFWGTKDGITKGIIKSGDTIYIAGGVYTRSWEPSGGPLLEAPITIKRATKDEHGTDKGWLDSFDTQVVLNQAGIILWNCNNIIIDGSRANGIKIKMFAGKTAAESSVHAYGVLLTPYNDSPSDFITLRNLEIEGEVDGLKPGDDVTNSMIGIKSTPLKNPSATDLIIENCYVHHLVSTGLQLERTNKVIVQNCRFGYFNDQWCANYPRCWHESFVIATDCNNLVFRNNTFYNSGSDGISIREGNKNCYIHNNVFYTTPDFNQGRSGKGVNTTKPNKQHKSVWNENRGLVIYNNTFVNMYYGLVIDNSVADAEIFNNLFYNCKNNIIDISNHDYNWFSGKNRYGEPHGVAGGWENPFSDLPNFNFTLKKGSSPVDAGKNLPKRYYEASPQLFQSTGKGRRDIGAYEYY